MVGSIGPLDRGTETWTAYSERMQLYLAATPSSMQIDDAVFLSLCGPHMYQLIRSLLAPIKPTDKTLEELFSLVKDHLEPAPSAIMQHFNFNARPQKVDRALLSSWQSLDTLWSTVSTGAHWTRCYATG